MVAKITMKSPSQANKIADASDKVTKSSSVNRKLPLARVKKIAKMDEDVQAISNAALAVIAAATEKFAAYFAEQAFFYTLADKKKSLNYKHLSSAVSRLPTLDFLADVVPPTVRIADTEQWQTLAAQKRRDEANSKSGGIPEWAKAHPEALAKMQAAEARDQAATTGNDSATSTQVDENTQRNGTSTESTGLQVNDILNPRDVPVNGTGDSSGLHAHDNVKSRDVPVNGTDDHPFRNHQDTEMQNT